MARNEIMSLCKSCVFYKENCKAVPVEYSADLKKRLETWKCPKYDKE